jgi:uncharacterized membrane protein YeaQ/YmgE (transglycosylase-associated protein family)
MTDQSLAEIAAQAAHEILLWVGFGTLVGLAAKAVMPGRDPGGTLATLLMGIAGSVIGCGTMTFISSEQRITPISPMGFVLATAGAFVLLFFHRLLAGSMVREGQDRNLTRWWYPLRRRRRVLVQEVD